MSSQNALVFPCTDTKVSIARNDGEYRVLASELIVKGDFILTVEGRLTSEPSKYSVQVGLNEHIDIDTPEQVEQFPERYVWRFLNHSNRPNGVLRGRQLFALEDIPNAAEITFNYNANEYDMAEPFKCWQTGQTVAGFKHLSADEREALRNCVSDHLKSYLPAARARIIGQ